MMKARTVAWLSHKHRNRKDSARIEWRPLVDTILSECHEKQRGFVEDDAKRICAIVARGGGKTTGGRARFVIRMLKTRRARCCFIATSRQQAEEFMWAPLKDLLQALAIPAIFNETKLKCTFLHNGSTLRLVGADDKKSVDKLRGQPFHEVGVDESASYSKSLFSTMLDRVIIPRLGDFDGTLWCIGTPGHILDGGFYDMTRVGGDLSRAYSDRHKKEFEGWFKWSRHHWTMEDGAKEKLVMANLWKNALIEKELKGWEDDNPIWRREYLGFWAADDTENVYRYSAHDENGDLWNQWDPPRDRYGWAIMPDEFDDWRYSYGQDMGASDPYALEIVAWSPSDHSHTLYHVFEFTQTKMYARKIAELILGEDPKDGTQWPDFENLDGCIGHKGWPDAISADMAGLGGNMLDELAEVYGLRIKPAKKQDKHDNIELTNGDLVDGRAKILKGSELEAQLLQLQWAPDEYGRLREHKGMRNDATDAYIYARRDAAHLISGETEHVKENHDPHAPPSDDSSDNSDSSDIENAQFLDSSNYSESEW